ncbi:MAG: Nif3-like dinuclear metal center hexameric protein, partial [Lachnospiraceae bacterium]|nr:Nif3-like dinuclear metal center hexameric protein [Lachnospiraceae bacterium]
MKIEELIEIIKQNCLGMSHGKKIDPVTSRDQVLFGAVDKECTGIVVTCYVNPAVIQNAHERGANFIICHESMFWNHGDTTSWLSENEVYQYKKRLLEKYDITVWRFHDYIHSGIRLQDGTYADGIFYGLMKQMGWEGYL